MALPPCPVGKASARLSSRSNHSRLGVKTDAGSRWKLSVNDAETKLFLNWKRVKGPEAALIPRVSPLSTRADQVPYFESQGL